MKKIVIIGAGGLLGTDLMKTESSFQKIPYHRDADITNFDLIYERLSKDQPDMVLNTAAWNDVDGAESNIAKTYLLNATGPENLARICERLDIPLVQLSTDYVFGHGDGKPKTETDKPSPLNVYGKSKLAGEEAVSTWKKHYIFRLSSLYGHSRPNYALNILEALKNKTRIKLASDLLCSPTYAGHLAKMIFEFLKRIPLFGLYHVVSQPAATRLEFAEILANQGGYFPLYPFDIVNINNLGLPATRPTSVCLDTRKWVKNFGEAISLQEGVVDFLENFKKAQS